MIVGGRAVAQVCISLAFLSGAAAAGAFQSTPVLVRAIGEPPSAEIVAYVARNAEAIRIAPGTEPWAESATVGEIAAHLCETAQPAYLDEVARRNGLAQLSPEERRGPEVFDWSWPACLKVRGPVSYTVRPGDHLTSIRLHATGDFADDDDLRVYFADSGIVYEEHRSLQPGVVLTLPFETLRTLLNVPSANAADFAGRLRQLAGSSVEIDEDPRVVGRIIVPHRPGRIGTAGGADADCVGSDESGYPYNPLEVANAYNAVAAPQETVTVAIVDNGFFGVPCTAEGCPPLRGGDIEYSDRFPHSLFAPRDFYRSDFDLIGPRLSGTTFGPINYGLVPRPGVNEISGHGTHVAALALGGPRFQPHRELLMDRASGRGRVNISILSVAPGTEFLAPAADRSFDQHLGALAGPDIVNLSVTFDSQIDPATETRIEHAIEERPGTIFVVAAGNGDGFDLDTGRYYPAALGGPRRNNVITVASLDADGSLSDFSNVGATSVDLAAPGCRISSWINAEGPPIAVSGTSQAAPLVSFAAALLRSKWRFATPRAIKNRLAYSGDLLRNASDRSRIASKASLNIQQSLFYRFDYVEFRSGDTVERLLGTATRFSGASCPGETPEFDQIRSIKMAEDRAFIYLASRSGPLRVCEGRLAPRLSADVENIIFFEPLFRLEGAAVVSDRRPQPVEIRAAQLLEYIRHE